MKNRLGFTLIELLISVTVLAVIISSGVNIFFRSLRDSSRSDLRKIIDERSRIMIVSLTRYLREAKLISLDGVSHSACVTAGMVVGTSLVAADIYGVESTLSLSAGKISSVAGSTTLILNPETAISVAQQPGGVPLFTWYCSLGVPDRLTTKFNLAAVGEGGAGTINSDYVFDLTLRNSGQ